MTVSSIVEIYRALSVQIYCTLVPYPYPCVNNSRVFRMTLFSQINSRSPPSSEIDEVSWISSTNRDNDGFEKKLVELSQSTDNGKITQIWSEIKKNRNIERLIHSPGLMRFLYKCIRGKKKYFLIFRNIISH